MTVRIAQNLGINKIASFAKDLNIYENPEELLSLSLGSSETTLLKLTSAYCSFVNGGKLIIPKFIEVEFKIVKELQYLIQKAENVMDVIKFRT